MVEPTHAFGFTMTVGAVGQPRTRDGSSSPLPATPARPYILDSYERGTWDVPSVHSDLSRLA
jgi:hypothetical protein